MIVAVGTENHLKVNAVKLAAEQLFGEVEVYGLNVPSGVSSQPRTDAETKKGARLRAERVLKAVPEASIGIGVEGGVHPTRHGLMSTVWVCVVDRDDGGHWYSNGLRHYLPKRVADAISAGGEMGPVMDAILKQKDTKKKQGTIGVLTKGKIDRTSGYVSVIQVALGLWHGRDWEKDLA